MDIFVTKNPNGILTLMARAEGDGEIGDFIYDLAPGQSALGKSYDEWAAEAAEVAPRGEPRTLYAANPRTGLAAGDEFATTKPLVATPHREADGPVLVISMPDSMVDCERGGRVLLPRGLKLRVTSIDGDATHVKAVKPKKKRG